jgi:hypothetical protein
MPVAIVRTAGVVLLAIVVISLFLGCGSRGPAVHLHDAARWLPQEVHAFDLVDSRSLRADPELACLYQNWKREWGVDLLLEPLGVTDSQVTSVIWAEGPYQGPDDWAPTAPWIILSGEIDPDDLGKSLHTEGYISDPERGVEVWVLGPAAVGLMEGYIVLGSLAEVSSCIRVMHGEADSLYEDTQVHRVLEEAPSGYLIRLDRAGEGASDRGYQSASFSLAKKDSNTQRVDGVFLFPDGYPADDAEGRAAEEMINFGPGVRVLDVDWIGRLVRVHAELDLPRLTQ